MKTRIFPLVGLSRAPIRLRRVVFPAPDGPYVDMNSPASTVRSICSLVPQQPLVNFELPAQRRNHNNFLSQGLLSPLDKQRRTSIMLHTRMFVWALKALWYNHLMTSRRECVDAFVSTCCQGRYLKGHRGFLEGIALKTPPMF